MKPAVVLDKSFLQGTSAERMHQLATSCRLLMTDALFYELVSNPTDRKLCFAKFPLVENPVDLVMHVGGYLRKEIDRRRPAPRPSRTIERVRFQFNPQLLSAEYRLPPEAQEAMDEQHAELQADIRSLIARVELMPTLFPGVFVGDDRQRKAEREAAESVIANDRQALLEFYGQFRAPKGQRRLPPKRLLTEDWALYRWLQVHLLFALDLACRQRSNMAKPLTPKLQEKLEHDVLDSQYMIVGVLEGSFATHEKKLQDWYSLICPKGVLYGKDG